MESEGSRNEEDVSMKLLPKNEGEVPDDKSGGNEDVSTTWSEGSDTSDTSDTSSVDWEVLHYFHNC